MSRRRALGVFFACASLSATVVFPSTSQAGSPRIEVLATANRLGVGDRPWLVRGNLTPRLTSPVDDLAAVDAARSALAAHLSWTAAHHLDLERVDVRDDGSRLVQFSQTLSGIAVYQRGARALVELDGVVTLVSAELDERTSVSTTLSIDASAAAIAAGRGVCFAFDSAHARLMLVPRADGLRLAWRLNGVVPSELPFRPVAIVDAATSRVMLVIDAARSAKQVHAFATNPIDTPTLATFTLASLSDGATKLETAAWHARSCVDKGTLRTVTSFGSPISMHVCDLAVAAPADAAGDFLYPRPPKDSAVDDPLSETSLAYHTDRVLSFFVGLGLPALRKEARPLTLVANARLPPGFGSGTSGKLGCASCPLDRFDNAFYSPSPDPMADLFGVTGDGLFFGQGTTVDYAYDGDVVYHEFTHAVVESTAKLAVEIHVDEQGAIDSPGAINECLADFFSSALAGDPRVGEYAGGGTAIRNLDNSDRCPDRIANEVHFDSTAFSGALWSARSTLPTTDARKFDRGVLLAMQVLPSGDVGFEQMAAAIVAGVSKEAGDLVGATLKDAFAKRSLTPCTRVREITSEAKSPLDVGYLSYGLMHVLEKFDDDVVPGALQFEKVLPDAATEVTVSLDGQPMPSNFGSAGDWNGVMLARFDAPIRWSKVGSAWKANYTVSRKLTPGDGAWTESIAVPPGAKRVYVMIGAAGDADGLYDHVAFSVTTKPVLDGGVPDEGVTPDARPDSGIVHSDAGADASTSEPSTEPDYDILNGRACACRAVGTAPERGTRPVAPTLIGLSIALGWARLRRRGWPRRA